ncbi:MAG: hypothetical protein RIS29_27 [Bacteroidota bacterium]|jgi:NadR type nicotinamide-nucleotide adenylyltransferase
MIKIAILGPESTGKTYLAQQLATHFSGQWIPEYAREYVEKLNRSYTYEDVCAIAEQQINTEKSIAKNNENGIVFFDTELIITKVWFEYCYKHIPQNVLTQLNSGFFDFYLLCNYDLPWEADPVREHGDDRAFFFEWYRREIELTAKPYVIISGEGKNRTQNAIKAIDTLLKTNNLQYINE